MSKPEVEHGSSKSRFGAENPQWKGGVSSRLPRRARDEPNPEVSCLCGCGERFLKYRPNGKAREYVLGHKVKPDHARQSVLEYLKKAGGPRTKKQILSGSGCNPSTVAQLLKTFVRERVVHRIDRGVYLLRKMERQDP